MPIQEGDAVLFHVKQIWALERARSTGQSTSFGWYGLHSRRGSTRQVRIGWTVVRRVLLWEHFTLVARCGRIPSARSACRMSCG